MHFLEVLYRSPFGRVMSMLARSISWIHQPFMVYGMINPATREFHKYSRVSSSVVIVNRRNLSIGNHVWVGHYCILDATAGLTIGEGCQFSPWVGVFTHGSENSIRLLGQRFVHVPNMERPGYTRGRVEIGAYTYIGAGAIILPGVKIGKGCLVGAGSVVTDDLPDFSFAVGQPAEIRGSTLDRDVEYFRTTDLSATYYDEQALQLIRDRLKE